MSTDFNDRLWAYPGDTWAHNAELDYRRERITSDFARSRRPARGATGARSQRPARALRMLHLQRFAH